MDETAETESKIKELIEKFVSDHWTNAQSACYLSAIGTYLKAEVPDCRAVLSKGLRDFLRQNPVVQVVQFPGIEQKVGAVPLSVSLPDDIRDLFSKTKQAPPSNSRNVYLQEFWDAFFRPIEGHQRYVLLDDTGRVRISDEPPNREDCNAYEIAPEDLSASLPNEPIVDKVNATHAAIDSWLEKHSLDPRQFVRPGTQKQDIAVGSRLAGLIRALDGLPHEDLSRITIPLDVLIKLNSKE